MKIYISNPNSNNKYDSRYKYVVSDDDPRDIALPERFVENDLALAIGGFYYCFIYSYRSEKKSYGNIFEIEYNANIISNAKRYVDIYAKLIHNQQILVASERYKNFTYSEYNHDTIYRVIGEFLIKHHSILEIEFINLTNQSDKELGINVNVNINTITNSD